MMSRDPKNRRCFKVIVRLTDSEYHWIERHAKSQGVSISEAVRMGALNLHEPAGSSPVDFVPLAPP